MALVMLGFVFVVAGCAGLVTRDPRDLEARTPAATASAAACAIGLILTLVGVFL